MSKSNGRTNDEAKRRELAKEVTKSTDSKVDRFEVIDDTGRAYVKGGIYGSPVSVELSYQDDGRTLKVFVTDKTTGEKVTEAKASPSLSEEIKRAKIEGAMEERKREHSVNLKRWKQLEDRLEELEGKE